MAIAFTNLGATNAGGAYANPDFGTASSLASYANSSWTPPSAGLILLFVASGQAAGPPAAPTCSGNGITWTNIASVTQGTTYRFTLFAANAAGSTTGATTVDFGGTAQDGKGGFVMCYATGVDLTGTVAAAFVQAPAASGFGTTVSTTMSAASNVNNRPIALYGAFAPSTQFTETASWTEMDDGSNGWVRLGSEYRTDQFDTAPSVTYTTSSNWGIVACELKAASAVSAIKSLIVNVTPDRW